MITEFHFAGQRLLFDLHPEQFVSDADLMTYYNANQAPEPETIHVMLRALKAGDWAIDAGANIGFFTVLMSKLVGDKGGVVAIEPDARNLQKLRKNLDINSCNNVKIVEAPLDAVKRTVTFAQLKMNGMSSVHPHDWKKAETTRSLNTTTLDEILRDLPARPRLLKLDIEGSEHAALEGCLQSIPIVLSELNEGALKRAGKSAHHLVHLMRHRGYGCFQPHPSGAMPSTLYETQSIKITRENTTMLFARSGLVASELWKEVAL